MKWIDELWRCSPQLGTWTPDKDVDGVYIIGDHVFQESNDIAMNLHILPSLWKQHEAEHKQYKEKNVSLSHKHSFFEISFVFSGSFYGTVGTDSIKLNKNDIIILNPWQVHAPYVKNDTDIVVNLMLRESFVERICLNSFVHNNLLFNFFMDYIKGVNKNSNFILIRDAKSVNTIITTMVECFIQKKPAYMNSLMGMSICLLAEIACLYDQQQKNTHRLAVYNGTPAIDQILQYIRDHYTTITLPELAERFNYSVNYLCKLIKQSTGYSFKELTLRYKMESACNLLLTSDFTIEHIGQLLGFKDIFYISRIFKKTYGFTPVEYRKLNKCERIMI